MIQKIYFLKIIDPLWGKLICNILSKRKKSFPNISAGSRILFIRPGGIGDAVLLIPAVQALKEKFPEATVDVLAEKRNASIFSLCPQIDTVFQYDTPTSLLKAIRSKPDVVIDTEQWHRLSAIVARLTDAENLIGFATNERKRLFNHKIWYSHDDYEVDSFLNLLSPLDISNHQVTFPFLKIPPEANQKATKLLGTINKPFVGIFPGASISARQWGSEKFTELAKRTYDSGFQVVVVGGKEDKDAGEKIALTKGINLAGKTNLEETAAIIDQSTLLISGDSGILHIGVGLGKPTVSLFGPGISKKWAPCGSNHIVINKNLSCSPCTKFGYTPKCPHNTECMKQITVDEVFDAAMVLLNKKNQIANTLA